MLRDVYGRPKLHLPEVKMSGLIGTITMGTTVQHTYECKVECCDLIEGAAAGQEILEILRVVDEQAPSEKKAGTAFKSVDDTKEVPLDPESADGQMVHIKANLPPKLESVLVNFQHMKKDIFAWKPSHMREIPRDVTEHSMWVKLVPKPVRAPRAGVN
jgi:hypothetical protein